MNILHIDASPRATRSRSRVVAERFIAALPNTVNVTHCNVWDVAMPDLDGDMIEGRYALIMGEAVDDSIAERWAEVRRFTDWVMAHDAFILSVPMWNFGIPYRLKHFIDVVTQPGMAFTNDAAGNVVGLAAGKRAMIIAASAMPFGQMEDIADIDFQLRYLRAWLDFIGVTDVQHICVAPTFGAPDAVEAVMAEVGLAAETMARHWASRPPPNPRRGCRPN